ncbi:MAG: helix-turn-helix domain-containing protein [Solirubrobacteraceae bacterium]
MGARQANRRRYDDLPIGPGSIELGEAIRRRRESSGLSLTELARRASVDRSHLARVEAGSSQLGWRTLGLLANALQIRVSTLARDAERESTHRVEAIILAPPSADALGHAVRRLRQTKGATIETLALSVGLHPTSLAKIEHAQRQPTWATLCDLAAALSLTTSTLIKEAEP